MCGLLRLFEVAKDRGFLINDLSQLDNGPWVAGIRSMKTNQKKMFYFQSGRGVTPVAAMKAVLSASEDFKPEDYTVTSLYRDGP